jgi:hypothetical protein
MPILNLHLETKRMSSSDEYKRQVMKDLSGGNMENLDDNTDTLADYQTFDDFAQTLLSQRAP